MMNYTRPLFGLSLVLMTSACTPSQPSAAPAVTSSAAFEKAARLGQGINLGNALEAPHEGQWGVTLRDEDFALVAAAGFRHVRIPIRWSAHAAEEAPYTIAPQLFERVDWAVRSALDHGLAAIINVHHYEEMAKDPDAHGPRLVGLWEQIARHFSDSPEELYFELFNEPNEALTADKNNALIAELLTVVRASNPERAVIVGGTQWNSFRGLPELELPASDQDLIVTFHYYEPFDFTHQGAPWVNKQKEIGIDWPGSVGTEANIAAHFRTAVEWGKAQGRPLYLGEFGAYSAADMAARVRWTRAVAEEAAQHGLSSAYWELRSGFGAYDMTAGTWHEPLLRALLPSQPHASVE